jgi:ATP-dependent RNA helicase RhlE
MTFNDLGLIDPIKKALSDEGYLTPTPIQQQSIPILLKGNDLLGCAQTGTGKTAAFAIPIIQFLYNKPSQDSKKQIKALILTPTRELAIQIFESFNTYGKYTGLKSAVIFGGVSQSSQVDTLKRGIDILIATPGRLLDLIGQGFVNLKTLDFFVLDEADRMLDMGFVNDVKKIITKIPEKRQSLFFSATMPPSIMELAHSILKNPSRVEVTPESTTAESVQQKVFFVEKNNKRFLLEYILEQENVERLLVFTKTKHGANKVVKNLEVAGIRAEAIHGNKSQVARQNALANFKNHKTRVLVATDIAARGIDIDDLAHVVNYELPNVPETYVHRIGRTGRAGASGVAFSFCDQDEWSLLKDIQKLINFNIDIMDTHPYTPGKYPDTKSMITERKQELRKPIQRNYSQQSSTKPKTRKWFKPKQKSTNSVAGN